MSFDVTRRLLQQLAQTVTLPFPVAFDGAKSVQTGRVWGKWWVVQGETMQAIIGPGHTRGVGMMALQVFQREESPETDFTRAADAVAKVFDRQQLRAAVSDRLHVVTLRTAGFTGQGGPPAPGYIQRNISITWQRDTYVKWKFGFLCAGGIAIGAGTTPFSIEPL